MSIYIYTHKLIGGEGGGMCVCVGGGGGGALISAVIELECGSVGAKNIPVFHVEPESG